MKDRIQKIFQEAIAIPSFTNTETERLIEDYLDQSLGSLPYFQEHPDQFGRYLIPDDVLKRSVNWALVDKGVRDTVIFFHHHDTVDLEDYGLLAPLALKPKELEQELRKSTITSDLRKDLDSGDWCLGRGSCDMKAALALQFGVLEEYASMDQGEVNLLYLSVGDEEAYSRGMRAALPLLKELRDRFDLHYILAVDSEPFESEEGQRKVLHIGTVGKVQPVIVTQGLLTHMKEPLKGINALSLLIQVGSQLDLNPLLADQVGEAMAPLPSWSYLRDRKDHYDVSTVLHAAAYLSVLHLKKTPAAILETICELCETGVDQFYQRYCKLQEQAEETSPVERPEVWTYEFLLEKCQQKPDFETFHKNQLEKSQKNLLAGTSYQELAIQGIQDLLEFYGEKEALVIVGFAPPYYPSMNCRNLAEPPIAIEKLIQHYQTFLEDHGQSLQVEEYFMGICDTSYCALEKAVDQYQVVLDSMAVPSSLYPLDLEIIDSLHIPAVNLGPWGKELHQRGERVYREDLLETIPDYLLHLLQTIDQIRPAKS